jgi:hypothetical protein
MVISKETYHSNVSELNVLIIRRGTKQKPGGVRRLSGRDFMGARQLIKRRPGVAQRLTLWKVFHGCTSAHQTEARSSTVIYVLEGIGISWVHVGSSKEARRSTATHVLDFMGACQLIGHLLHVRRITKRVEETMIAQ